MAIMMVSAALLPALLNTSVPSNATDPVASSGVCPDVLDYESWKEAPGQGWDYRSPKLTIIGASHVRDPAHEQFAPIASAFAEEKPTIAFFEGPDRGVEKAAEEAIRKGGESGYLRLLAKQAAIESRSLEPSPPEQLKSLAKQFPIDQVLLFFALREGVRLPEREDLSGEELQRTMATLLQRVTPHGEAIGVSLPFSDTAGLQAAFNRYWPGRNWWEADTRWFSPRAKDAETGGIFTGAVNRADSRNRDRHFVRLLSKAVDAGEKPFVVVGRNHVPMIAGALDCALKKLP